MNINFNQLPSTKVLPDTFNGKKPLHVAQASIQDTSTEPEFKVLCSDGSYEMIPLSACPEVPKEVPKEVAA